MEKSFSIFKFALFLISLYFAGRIITQSSPVHKHPSCRYTGIVLREFIIRVVLKVLSQTEIAAQVSNGYVVCKFDLSDDIP